MRYDPERAPVPSEWLEASEAERLDAVLRFHAGLELRAESARLHAAFHVTVETQIAEGMAAAAGAVERLLVEGLDRHEALHAIGAVAADQVYRALKNSSFDAQEYERRLDALTAESWRASSERESAGRRSPPVR